MSGFLLMEILFCLVPFSVAQVLQGAEVQNTHPPTDLPASQLSFIPNLTNFVFSLYHQMAQESNTSNIAFSPISIASSLATLSLGAQGDTLYQILEGMHFNLSQRAEAIIHHDFQHLLHSLNQPDNKLQLNMGSGLFIQEGFKLAEKFLEDAKTLYHSEVFSTNFKKPEKARKQINDYVQKRTQGRIVNLVKKLSKYSVLNIVNYIFFKGKWEKPFDAEWTMKRNFHVDKHITIKVPMMSCMGRFQSQRYDTLSSWVLMLHYVGNATAMFLLPDQGKMQQLEDALSSELLTNLLDNRETSYIGVRLPKMSISGTYDLIPILSSMGISRVFTDRAQLSGITKERPVKVSQALHRAVVTMDEKGTEASGATSLEIRIISGPLELTFDRPFLIIIIDDASKMPLFVGRVVNPSQE